MIEHADQLRPTELRQDIVWTVFASIGIHLALALAWLFVIESGRTAAQSQQVEAAQDRTKELDKIIHDLSQPGADQRFFKEALVSKKEAQYLRLSNIWKAEYETSPIAKLIQDLSSAVAISGYAAQMDGRYAELCVRARGVFPATVPRSVSEQSILNAMTRVCQILVDSSQGLRPPTRAELVSAIENQSSDEYLRDLEANYDLATRLHPVNLRQLAKTIRQDLQDERSKLVGLQERIARARLEDRLLKEPEGTKNDEDGRDKVVRELADALHLLHETQTTLRGQ